MLDRKKGLRQRGVLIGAMVIASGVWVNAIWFQNGRHPAPLFPQVATELSVSTPSAVPASVMVPQWRWETDGQAQPKRYRPQTPQLVSPPPPLLRDDQTSSLSSGSPNKYIIPVRQLQSHLSEMGFYSGDIDGLGGPMTEAAVLAYQKAAGLPTDGQIGNSLMRHVVETWKQVNQSESKPRKADGDAQVRAVQNVLAHLGYAPGPIDGLYGTATETAIKQFERDRGLPVTGQITPRLARELSRVSGETIPGRG